MHTENERLQAVVFDLDGTLIDSINHIVNCWQHTVRTCLGREIAREEVLPTIGKHLIQCLEEIAPGRGMELFQVYRDYDELSHDTMITLVPGTLETLARLRKDGLRLGVVTSKGRDIALRGLRLFGLDEHFEVLVTREDTLRHKPHPDPLLEAARQLGVPPGKMIYVGDAVVDIEAGRAAGALTAWVRWGAEDPTSGAAQPDFVIGRMDEVADVVSSQGQVKNEPIH